MAAGLGSTIPRKTAPIASPLESRAFCEILKGRCEKSRKKSSTICPESELKWAIPAHKELGTSLVDFCRDPAKEWTKASRLDRESAINARDTCA
jgi:hypothetical protein